MAVDSESARKLCNATEWRLVQASEPDAINGLTPAKLKTNAAKAAQLRETWNELVARFERLGPGPAELAATLAASVEDYRRKAELFTDVAQRFENHRQQREASTTDTKPKTKSRRQASAAPSSGPLSSEALITQLRKLKFFDGYTPDGAAAAKERIRRQYEAGLAGPYRSYFERFPGFALSFIAIEGEWDFDPYEPLVETVAENSFGMFRPCDVTDERDEFSTTLSFSVSGTRYSRSVEDAGGWVPPEFLELIEEAFAEQCNALQFHETHLYVLPSHSGSCTWTICTTKAYKNLQKAKLIPSEPGEV